MRRGRGMALTLGLAALAGAGFGIGCQKESNAPAATKPFDKPNLGMAPSTEHPGKSPEIPEPEPGHDTAMGREKIPAPGSPASVESPGATVVGTVEAKGKDQLRILDETGQEVALKLAPSTRAVSDRQPIQVAELKEGARVRASYKLEGDQKVADELEVLQQP